MNGDLWLLSFFILGIYMQSSRSRILEASATDLVTTLTELNPTWPENWSRVKGFSGQDIAKCSEDQLTKLVECVPAAIWLFNILSNDQKVDSTIPAQDASLLSILGSLSGLR